MFLLASTSPRRWLALVACFGFGSQVAHAGRLIDTHVPAAARELLPLSELPPHQRLPLAIGLPLRDPAGVDAFIRDVSDPGSPNFRRYLTPDQFTERFGPTEEEYQAVIQFAEAHGLTVTGLHPNRLVVDVDGSVADVEQTFHIKLRNYRHPVEDRIFFAPDTEPVVDGLVPIAHVSGLTSYWVPRPKLRKRPLEYTGNDVSPKNGTGPTGTYIGLDFRAAYVPGTSLTGAGQVVGLLEFDGYNPNNVALYLQTAGLSSVPLENVLVDGSSGGAGSDNSEACLDIEVAIAMAPGLAKVLVYEAPNSSPWEDILSRMANDNRARQLSCSWGGGPPSSTAEQIFKQMAAQGQTFFNATGDDDAYTGLVPFPSDSPSIVQVGGTSLLTLTPGGAWSGETVWNWGNGSGSSGGASTVYPIPAWQQPLSMVNNQGSAAFRNFPDVALTADNIYSVADNGLGSATGGTSAAAPLWAGFTALVNEHAANNGQAAVGFINPALYTIARGGSYSVMFHDITSGNNITSRSSGKFSAVTGFDLCTGWGTPTGALISALLSPGTPVTTYTVSLTVAPVNAGSVSGGAVDVAGTEVTVVAKPNYGFAFTAWTENGVVVSTSPSYSFTLSSNRSLVATFSHNLVLYSVSLSASPTTAGAVSGGGTFAGGFQHMVSAAPRRRFMFVSWTENGAVVSTTASYLFTLEANRNLVANFAPRRGRHRHR